MGWKEGTCSYCGKKGHTPFPSIIQPLPRNQRTEMRTYSFRSPCEKLEADITRLREKQFEEIRKEGR